MADYGCVDSLICTRKRVQLESWPGVATKSENDRREASTIARPVPTDGNGSLKTRRMHDVLKPTSARRCPGFRRRRRVPRKEGPSPNRIYFSSPQWEDTEAAGLADLSDRGCTKHALAWAASIGAGHANCRKAGENALAPAL